jgi:hypothetical protein
LSASSPILYEEVNESLMEEITKEELWSTLQSFQKDKSLRLDVLTVEFNTRCFDILGEDVLRVVEYSRTSGHILAPFNVTLLVLMQRQTTPNILISLDLSLSTTTSRNNFKINSKHIEIFSFGKHLL